jgi:hypothetical protein
MRAAILRKLVTGDGLNQSRWFQMLMDSHRPDILNPDLFRLFSLEIGPPISIPATDKAQRIRYRLKGYILQSSAQSNVGLAALHSIAGHHQPG